MIRIRRWVGAGALAGAALSAWLGYAERAAIAAGQSPAGAGFGTSHLLFFVSLPWSLLVLVACGAAGNATGADGPAFLRPFFYAMPVVAGAGWGGLAGLVRAALGPRVLRRDLEAARARARDT